MYGTLSSRGFAHQGYSPLLRGQVDEGSATAHPLSHLRGERDHRGFRTSFIPVIGNCVARTQKNGTELYMVLEEEGDQDTSLGWIVRERGAIPSVICDRAGHEIGKGEQGEGPASLGPCEYGPAHPFDNLA